MNVLVNGIPKNGTHAALKAVELLGVPVYLDPRKGGAVLGHVPYKGASSLEYIPEVPSWDKHVVIIRHPRNALLSMMRSRGHALTSGMIRAKIQCVNGKQPYVVACTPFIGWIRDPDTHVVRYEELISDPTEMDRLAEYLEVPPDPLAFENLPGLTVTWNPEHCDYRDLTSWDGDVNAVWEHYGGARLERALGYVS